MQVYGDFYSRIEYEQWQDMSVPSFIQDNISRCRFDRPTPVQRLAIPAILGTTRDVMVSSQTGMPTLSWGSVAWLVPGPGHSFRDSCRVLLVMGSAGPPPLVKRQQLAVSCRLPTVDLRPPLLNCQPLTVDSCW